MTRRTAFIIIGIITVFFCTSLAYASGVNKDGTGDWHISTYPAGETQHLHMVFGLVFVPYKGITYDKYYGRTDTTECSSQMSRNKAKATVLSYKMLTDMLELLGYEEYIISMAVSVCHPDWYVIYISIDFRSSGSRTNRVNASKEVYDKVLEVLQ